MRIKIYFAKNFNSSKLTKMIPTLQYIGFIRE